MTAVSKQTLFFTGQWVCKCNVQNHGVGYYETNYLIFISLIVFFKHIDQKSIDC